MNNLANYLLKQKKIKRQMKIDYFKFIYLFICIFIWNFFFVLESAIP